jgi:hypothetical protein
MRTVITAVVATAFLLTACGGSAAPLAASEVIPKLEASGIDCTETADQPVEDGIAATAVTCAIGETGGIVTIVAESAEELDKAKSELCAQIPNEQGNLELASGNAWLSVALSTAGIGAAQVAEALGGQVAKIKDYCAV